MRLVEIFELIDRAVPFVLLYTPAETVQSCELCAKSEAPQVTHCVSQNGKVQPISHKYFLLHLVGSLGLLGVAV